MEGLTPEEHELLRQNKPIAAIVLIRNRTGMNLKDCKALLDKFRGKDNEENTN